jgi:hypothetical protein
MWILTVVKDEEMTEEDETNNDLIMSEDNLPLLKSKHFILTEKTKLEEGTTETNDDRRDSDSETANEKRLKEININYKLIRKLGFELHKEK